VEKFTKTLSIILEKNPNILDICKRINFFNGKTYLVGGTIRDIFFEFNYKADKFDFDIEVHNLTEEKLIAILSEFGTVSKIGSFFGVFSINGINAEFALPRIDGIGRNPEVKILKNITIEESLKRRDITINAIACELPFNGKIIDPFDGINCIKEKIIKAVNYEKFKDDPLRVFRVMRYMAIFELQIERKLIDLCKSMEIKGISHERIYQELYLMFLYAENPSIGLAFIEDVNKIEYISSFLKYEYKSLFEKPHYTFLMTDKISIEDKNKRLIYRFAAICVENTTKNITEIFKDGNKDLVNKIRFIIASRNRIKDCLSKGIKTEERLFKYKILAFDSNKFNLNLYELSNFFLFSNKNIYIIMLDLINSIGENVEFKPIYAMQKKETLEYNKFLKKAKELNILYTYEKPLLKGEDLLEIVKEEKLWGKILNKVYEYQISQINPKKDKIIKKAIEIYQQEKLNLFKQRD
jgi:tRNA nucleotidyltransferase/poly(A) polymerase